jgi:ABC-2 type transport system ATP-binding protein
MSAISVKNLKKYYTTKFPKKKETKAVDGISFEVKKGERFGFLGPNGAGKTTTIRSILGLLRNVEGEISILGEKIDPNKDTEFLNKISYIPGDFGLERELNGFEICEYLSKLYKREIDLNRVKEIAKRLDLDLTRPVQELSKGNRQKVGIVASLMGDFEILILDEPTSGLDPLIQSEFYKILNEMQERTNCTVFICSHILSEVEKYCDRVAIIRLGKILEISDISDLKERGLKRFELDFESSGSLAEFTKYLKTDFADSEIIRTNTATIEFLVPPLNIRTLLHEISEKQWDGHYIKNFNITNSSLEEIFMKYYRIESNGETNSEKNKSVNDHSDPSPEKSEVKPYIDQLDKEFSNWDDSQEKSGGQE